MTESGEGGAVGIEDTSMSMRSDHASYLEPTGQYGVEAEGGSSGDGSRPPRQHRASSDSSSSHRPPTSSVNVNVRPNSHSPTKRNRRRRYPSNNSSLLSTSPQSPLSSDISSAPASVLYSDLRWSASEGSLQSFQQQKLYAAGGAGKSSGRRKGKSSNLGVVTNSGKKHTSRQHKKSAPTLIEGGMDSDLDADGEESDGYAEHQLPSAGSRVERERAASSPARTTTPPAIHSPSSSSRKAHRLAKSGGASSSTTLGSIIHSSTIPQPSPLPNPTTTTPTYPSLPTPLPSISISVSTTPSPRITSSATESTFVYDPSDTHDPTRHSRTRSNSGGRADFLANPSRYTTSSPSRPTSWATDNSSSMGSGPRSMRLSYMSAAGMGLAADVEAQRQGQFSQDAQQQEGVMPLSKESSVEELVSSVADDDPYLLEIMNMTAQHYRGPKKQEEGGGTGTTAAGAANQQLQSGGAVASSNSSNVGAHEATTSTTRKTSSSPSAARKIFGRKKSGSLGKAVAGVLSFDRKSPRSSIGGLSSEAASATAGDSVSAEPHKPTTDPTSHPSSSKPSPPNTPSNQPDLNDPDFNPSPDTLTRSQRCKDYLSKRYNHIATLHHSGLRYNPLEVIRWRQQMLQRASAADGSAESSGLSLEERRRLT
ncbi:hypothetical protein HK102_013948, partial [Quaeritorhiza haematococci]